MNGIYIHSMGIWSRASDLADEAKASGIFTFVEEGTVNGDNGFVCTSDKGNDTVNTDSLAFSQFSGAGQITVTTPLLKSGNTISVPDDSITNNKLANKTISFGGVSLALGGTDATPEFDLSNATNYPTSSLSGTITNVQLANSGKLNDSTLSLIHI